MTSAKQSEQIKTNNPLLSNDFFLELKPGRPEINQVKSDFYFYLKIGFKFLFI